ncbi:unnamed protein product [Fraxinus pennsylvanica]|uniref:Uncharacterized protein n=1 Tax=Fraxinus pennsylvanica TaxID=56036 RepID=A0AAD2DZI9_9LAMI|nr:unnamed protein product [Fraxinus pennsylvanica]
MASLQRSSKSFRRQGSSGSVWNEKLAEEPNQVKTAELRHCRSTGDTGSGGMVEHGAAPPVYIRWLSTPSAKPLLLESEINGFACHSYEHEEKPKLRKSA